MVLPLLLLLCFQGNSNSLLERAAVITSTADWSGYVLYIPCYEWFSPTEIVFNRNNPQFQDDEPAEVFDTTSGRSTLLSARGEWSKAGWLHASVLTPSPDSNFFLHEIFGDIANYSILDRNGKKTNSWPMGRVVVNHHDETQFMSQIWTPDSRGVIDATFDYGDEGPSIDAQLHEVKNLAAKEVFPRATFSGYNRKWWPESCREGLWLSVINTESPFGMIFEDAPRTRALITTWYARRPEVRMTRFVTFPGNPEVSDWRYSPDGEEIVWFTTDAPTGAASWIYAYDSRERPTGPHFLRLWLSNWDGSGQRLLGRIELTEGNEYPDWHKFGWIRFIPGSRAISFVYKHRLYRLDLSKPENP